MTNAKTKAFNSLNLSESNIYPEIATANALIGIGYAILDLASAIRESNNKK